MKSSFLCVVFCACASAPAAAPGDTGPSDPSDAIPPAILITVSDSGSRACPADATPEGAAFATPGDASSQAGDASSQAGDASSQAGDASSQAGDASSQAAADPLCSPGQPLVSFGQDVLPVVGCSGEACHQPWQYKTLVGAPSRICCDHRPLVLPGAPSQSHLVQALRGVGACVTRMPPAGKVDDAAIAKVIAWICEGAPDD